jgi:hypothetical protein
MVASLTKLYSILPIYNDFVNNYLIDQNSLDISNLSCYTLRY